MTKMLTVTVDDTEKSGALTISGTLNDNEFNRVITLAIGGNKIAVESKELAEALKTIVDFQTPVMVPKTDTNTLPLFEHIGNYNLDKG